LIALIQFEFSLSQPDGYTSFGSVCGSKHPDPVVVLVDEEQFTIVSGLRDTVVNNYSAMPFLATGIAPEDGSMCAANVSVYGTRAYTGAILQHKDSGKEVCVISGTLPHCYGPWLPEFKADIEQGCGGRPLLLVVDTNAACEFQGPHAGKAWPMSSIMQFQSAAIADCSDPGASSPDPTCCHDIAQSHPEARYWYDRTALCGGGTVDHFRVNESFICSADEEHKYILLSLI
jgi:hypothetical protein